MVRKCSDFKYEDIIQHLLSDKDFTEIMNDLYRYDETTFLHSYNVSIACAILADALRLSDEEKKIITIGSALHDIGKIEIRKEVLNYPGKFPTIQMKEEMKEHALKGYGITKSLGYSDRVCNIVLQHHENYNGSGYPYGLKHDETDILAQICHICDVFSAITEKRVYKKAGTIDDALFNVYKNKGKMFNPEFVEVFMDYGPALKEIIPLMQDKFGTRVYQNVLSNNIKNVSRIQKALEMAQ